MDFAPVFVSCPVVCQPIEPSEPALLLHFSDDALLSSIYRHGGRMSSAKAIVRSGARVSLHMWKHCTAGTAISKYRRNTGCWFLPPVITSLEFLSQYFQSSQHTSWGLLSEDRWEMLPLLDLARKLGKSASNN